MKRQRANKCSSEEINALITGFTNNYNLFTSQWGDLLTLSKKKTGYAQVCEAVNAVGGNNRDVGQIKIKWGNETWRIKKSLSEKWREIERDMTATGGGLAKFTGTDEELFSTLTETEKNCECPSTQFVQRR